MSFRGELMVDPFRHRAYQPPGHKTVSETVSQNIGL
jgi:hypothetical protein